MEQPGGGFQAQSEGVGRAGLGQHQVPCMQRERGGHQSGGCSAGMWGAAHKSNAVCEAVTGRWMCVRVNIPTRKKDHKSEGGCVWGYRR